MSRCSVLHFILPGLFAGALLVHAGPAIGSAPTPESVAAKNAAPRRVLAKRPYNPSARKALPGSYAIAGNTYVSAEEYQDLAAGVKELLKRYSPEKYYFVGLGRDPAPVIAFLQNLGEKNIAANLPGTSNIFWNGAIGHDDVARHIEAAIPKHILQGDRQIVILDVTSSGKTPALFGPYLDHYLESKGIKKPSVKLAFSWNNVMLGAYNHQLTDWINTRNWADFFQYPWGKYEGDWTPVNGGRGIAEHQRHEMSVGAAPPTKTSPNYAAFRAALMDRMEQDKELDQFLVSHIGSVFKAESAEEAAQRVAAEKAALAAATKLERSQRASELMSARAVPANLTADLSQLVSKLTERADGHVKGPYLSQNAVEMNGWLNAAIEKNAAAATLVPAIAKKGANPVVAHYFDEIELARKEKKIRNRDYRRLMGHGLSAATMDEAMLTSLGQRFKSSKHFRREIMRASNYYLHAHEKKARPETENMAASYEKLVRRLPPEVREEITRLASKAEAKGDDDENKAE